jgi:nucleotide-binding universal stress UspA family protein
MAFSNRPEMTMKILIPVDGSEYTTRMLGYISAHDELLGPGHEYVVVHAVTAIPTHASRFLDRSTLDSYYTERAQDVLRPVKRFADQHHWTIRTLHAEGHPVDVIAGQIAAEKPDLVVMGTHGHTALGNVVLGSVANGVLARSKVPLLLIR